MKKCDQDMFWSFTKIFFKYIPINESSNVFEIGIGGGQATLPILKIGCKLTAVEYGENLAELCRFSSHPFTLLIDS